METSIARVVAYARCAQAAWAARPIAERLQVVRRFRGLLAEHASELAAAVAVPQRTNAAETLAAEILPLADACRFLERRAARLLAPRQERFWSRPIWMRGVSTTIHREPYGVVLVISPSNYPLLLTGVQALQALVAGNSVLLKPAPGAEHCTRLFAELLHTAGIPPEAAVVLDSRAEAASQAIDYGVDKVLLTGSAATGRAVLRHAAETLTPCTLELSGCDAAFLLPSADLTRVVDCLAYGLTFNGSATCIAPRRVLAADCLVNELTRRLSEQLRGAPPTPLPHAVHDRLRDLIEGAVAQGATVESGGVSRVDDEFAHVRPYVVKNAAPDMKLLQADVFAPIVSIVACRDADAMSTADEACPYALGASVFGDSRRAEELAKRLNAGCVTINDVIAPTADPRVPFGGRGESGYGTTRGAEGLLELTRPKCVLHRRRGVPPQLRGVSRDDEAMFSGLIAGLHGGKLGFRMHGWKAAVSAAFRRIRFGSRQR